VEHSETLTFHLFYLPIEQVNNKESSFYLLYGWDPTVLDMDSESVDVDTYKGEIAIKMDEAWHLARGNIIKTQRNQKNYYDQKPSSKLVIECSHTCLLQKL